MTQTKNFGVGSNETELKLTCRREDVAEILGLPFIADHLRYDPEHRELKSRYFDTPEGTLNDENVELRVRSDGDRWIQTMKVAEQNGDALGIYERQEFDAEVEDAELDFDLLPAPNGNGKLRIHKAKVRKKLQPIFETRISRTIHDLEVQGDLVEMVVDDGEVSSGEEVTTICQIELELKRGNPETLFAVASQIAKHVPLRLGSPRKADVGYQLLNRVEPTPTYMVPLKLRSKMTVEDAFVAILTNCLEQIRGNEAVVLESRDIEGVHQMRVGLRRLKSLFSVFASAIPKDFTTPFKEQLAVVAEPLGAARDWDVFIDERLSPIREALPEEKLFSDLQKAANRKRGYAYRKLRNAILSRQYGEAMIGITSWLVHRGWRTEMTQKQLKELKRPVRSLAEAMLKKGHQKILQKAGNLDLATDDAWHDLRLAIKKQRYSVGFFLTCFPGKASKAYSKASKRLQDHLGKLSDLVMADSHLQQLAGKDEESPIHIVSAALRGWEFRERLFLRDGLEVKWNSFYEAQKFWAKKK